MSPPERDPASWDLIRDFYQALLEGIRTCVYYTSVPLVPQDHPRGKGTEHMLNSANCLQPCSIAPPFSASTPCGSVYLIRNKGCLSLCLGQKKKSWGFDGGQSCKPGFLSHSWEKKFLTRKHFYQTLEWGTSISDLMTSIQGHPLYSLPVWINKQWKDTVSKASKRSTFVMHTDFSGAVSSSGPGFMVISSHCLYRN